MIQVINKLITIDKQYIEFCTKHATEFAASRIYQDSFQNSFDKIKLDSFVGKIGEFGVYFYLRSIGYSVNLPDISIYQRSDRNWNCDLVAKNKYFTNNVHVKSCVIDSSSWTFQADFSGRYDKEIFDCRNYNL